MAALKTEINPQEDNEDENENDLEEVGAETAPGDAGKKKKKKKKKKKAGKFKLGDKIDEQRDLDIFFGSLANENNDEGPERVVEDGKIEEANNGAQEGEGEKKKKKRNRKKGMEVITQ